MVGEIAPLQSSCYTHMKSRVWSSTHQKWCICLQLGPGRWRQKRLWCSLANHPSLICKPHVPVADPVSKQLDSFWGTILEIDPWYSVTRAYTLPPIQMHTPPHTILEQISKKCIWIFTECFPPRLHPYTIIANAYTCIGEADELTWLRPVRYMNGKRWGPGHPGNLLSYPRDMFPPATHYCHNNLLKSQIKN